MLPATIKVMPALTLTLLAALLPLAMGMLLLTLALMLRLRLPVTVMRLLMHRLPVIQVFVFPVVMIRIRLTPMIALPVGG